MKSQKLNEPAIEQEGEVEFIEDEEKLASTKNTEVSKDRARPKDSKKLPMEVKKLHPFTTQLWKGWPIQIILSFHFCQPGLK